MNRTPFMRRFFRLPLSERTVEAEVNDEVSFHIETRTEELVRLGWSAADARARSLREFGDVDDARSELARIDRERVRRRRRADVFDAARQDLVLALRMVRREPGFALAVILTLGLGIGLNAAMFGITDRLVFQPPAQVTNADQLKRLYFARTSDWVGYWGRATNYANYSALRSGVRAYQDLGAYFTTDGSLGRGQDAQKVRWMLSTASLISTLGVQAHLGRFYTEEEDRPGRAEPVVVLSYPFWQRHFGGAPSALGRTLYLGDQTYTVIGVAPRGFTGVDLEPVDVFTPLSAAAATMFGDDWATTRSMNWLRVIGRLGPEATLAQANAQATSIFKAGSPDLRDDRAARVTGESIILARAPSDGGSRTAATAQIALWLSGVSLLVLAIACANVMNLLLARATRRRREVVIRLALGVSRARLFGHFLTETMVLAVAGGAVGLVFANWGGRLARGLLLPDLDWSTSPLGGRVLVYTGALILICGLIAGLTPALHALRTNLMALLNSGVRAGGQPGARVRSGLVMLQAAVSVVLLAGAGLFVRSLLNVGSVHKGFDAERVVVLNWDLNLLNYTPRQTNDLYREAATQVRRVPGVANAAVGMTVPFWMWMRADFRAQGMDSIPQTEDGGPYYNAVQPAYFATLGTRILRGRGFT
ncbi:MAG TPA: ABC transporter permease, partial [Longimicrobiales bacterium]|nr:ABC transporter permease [Longimicrobiales bacterium]